MGTLRSILVAIGSLWFAAVILVLLLVAMACATVYESTQGTEQALRIFYHSRWFEALLALLAVNALAALVLRFPFTRREFGFVLTHGGLLVILCGALVTQYLGERGRVAIEEGQNVTEFLLEDTESLELVDRQDQSRATIDLTRAIHGRFEATDVRDAPALRKGDVVVEAVRYLPDSEWKRQVVNDNQTPQPAVEVLMASPGHKHKELIFAGRPVTIDGLGVAFRELTTQAELDEILNPPAAQGAASSGRIKIDFKSASFEFPTEEGLEQLVPLGTTGLSARVVRYLPHARVSEAGIVNMSQRAVNPYAEVEITGPDVRETLKAFAKFPEFDATHGQGSSTDLKLTLVTVGPRAPSAPIEVLGGPDGALFARFDERGAGVVTLPLQIGALVETPFAGRTFTVLRRYDRARVDSQLEAVEPMRKTGRTPGLLLRVEQAGKISETSVQKYGSSVLPIAGGRYEITLKEKSLPLGVSIALDKFHLGRYPGSGRPRSFESHVTVTEPSAGKTESRIISMNNPAKFGRYTFYQSSYQMGEGPSVTILSVARDPGQLVVFIGFFLLMGGMLYVISLRMGDSRRVERARASVHTRQAKRAAG